MPDDIVLSVDHVSQWYGDNKVLYDVNLKIIRGQFVALVGPSGCGKSTLLRAILGTDPPKHGSVTADGLLVEKPNRNVGIVYQRYGLYQFMTAVENVAFGPKLDQSEIWGRTFMPHWWWPLRKKHLQEAKEILSRFNLGSAANRYPCELSGGMQQRVAIAQATIMRPKILLLDEPFGALDESTRESLQNMLLTLYQENLDALADNRTPPWTVVIVTHELSEAFYCCDRVVALSKNWYNDSLMEADDTKGSNKLIVGMEMGATKVWDKCAPVFHPNEPRNFELFFEQKQQLRSQVLDANAPPVGRDAHVNFWLDLKQGVGTGVALKSRNDK